MRFTEETRNALANQGITISNVPYSEEQYRKEEMEHNRNWLCDYYCDTHFDCESKKIVIDKVNNQEEWDAKTLEYTDKWMNSEPMKYRGRWYESTEIYIKKDDMVFKRNVGKSQIITEDFVLKVIERDSKAYSGAYGEFAKEVNRMFKSKFGTIGLIYPTGYGIGVWVFYNYKAKECIENVESVLKGMGIEYRNEFSEANWVYRFVISKDDANRKRINA